MEESHHYLLGSLSVSEEFRIQSKITEWNCDRLYLKMTSSESTLQSKPTNSHIAILFLFFVSLQIVLYRQVATGGRDGGLHFPNFNINIIKYRFGTYWSLSLFLSLWLGVIRFSKWVYFSTCQDKLSKTMLHPALLRVFYSCFGTQWLKCTCISHIERN